MPLVELDRVTYDRLLVTSRLTDRPVGAVVRLLVDRLAADDRADRPEERDARRIPDGPAERDGPGQESIYKVYKRQRVEGTFNTQTGAVTISTAPWNGQSFSSPTKAARAVVEHFSPERMTSNTNGRKFWRLTSNGQDLRSIVGERRLF